MKLSDYVLRTLTLNGIHQIFGNPGTTEIPLVRRCVDPETPNYVVTLNEFAAVAMADGYARATRRPVAVNLHVAPGLGNAIGGIYTAQMTHTPLLLIVGAQDRRHIHTLPALHGPLVEMATPVTKASYAPTSRDDAAFYVKQALRTAFTLPYGPVLLACPLDLMEEEIEEAPEHISLPMVPGISEQDAQLVADFLKRAAHPAVIVTDEVYWNEAEEEVMELTSAVGTPVYVAPFTGVLPVSTEAAAFAGFLPPSREGWVQRLESNDALLFLGGKGLRSTLYSQGHLHQEKVWIGQDTDLLGMDGEYVLARVADIRSSAHLIRSALNTTKSDSRRDHSSVEVPRTSSGRLHPSQVVQRFLKALPEAVLIDESGVSTTDVRAWMTTAAGDYFTNGSGGIGWGLPASIGIQMALKDRQVIGLIGDGSMLYASEAMWTAAHHHLTLTVIVLVNSHYATLNEALLKLAGQPALDAFTLDPPAIDFSGLAQAFHWQHTRVDTEDELDRVLQQLPEHREGCMLLEIRVDPEARPVTVAEHF